MGAEKNTHGDGMPESRAEPRALIKTILPPTLALLICAGFGRAQTHTHGSMVGAIESTSIVVWTRASRACKVSVLLNSTASTSGANESSTVNAIAANDFCVKIPLTKLTPNTKYYYAPNLYNSTGPGSSLGNWGTFTTPPSPSTAAKVSFVVYGDCCITAH